MKTINIKRTLYKCVFGLIAIFSVTSCSLDEYNPSALSEENILINFNGWKSYQSNCYTGLWGHLLECNTESFQRSVLICGHSLIIIIAHTKM